MPFPKGQPRPAKGGRKAGTPNKVTKELKDMILGALDEAGGQKYLQGQADANPTAFLTLLGKVLPSEIKGAGANGEHLTKIEVCFVSSKG